MLRTKNLNVIYFVGSEKEISGGEKVIYRHSMLLNTCFKNITSEIIPLKRSKISKYKNSLYKILNKKKKYTGWDISDVKIKAKHKTNFKSKHIKFKNNLFFDRNIDFVIIPEIFAHLANDILIKNKIPYAIFVQNGFALNFTNNYQSLDNAYKNAKIILSVSEDTTKTISNVYENYSKKIFNINLSVGSNEFKPRLQKKNIISYMPRKLPEHSQKLLFMLKNKLPSNWKVQALDKISNEKKLFNLLGKSKIFLSFSHMEGLGLPPLEAAKEGNKVIGYTGEGGKEYWKKPIFTEIPYGNLNMYINEIMKCIKSNCNYLKFKKQRIKLYKKYSPQEEIKSLGNLLNKIF